MTNNTPQEPLESAPAASIRPIEDRASEALRLAHQHTLAACKEALTRDPTNPMEPTGIMLGDLIRGLGKLLGFRVDRTTALMLSDDSEATKPPKASPHHRTEQLDYSAKFGFPISDLTTRRLENCRLKAALQDREERERPLRQHLKEFDPRVNRVFSLPVPAFDYLKARQRQYQNRKDPSGESHTVTNSEALANILGDHYKLAMVAGFAGMDTPDLCNALAIGTYVVVKAPKAEWY